MVGAGLEVTTADLDAYLDHALLSINYHAEMVMLGLEIVRILLSAVLNGAGVVILTRIVASAAQADHVLLLINCIVEGGLSVAVFAVIQHNVAHLLVGADILINYQTPVDMDAYLDHVNRPTN